MTADVHTSRQPHARLYPKLLGSAWSGLHPEVQRVHTRPGSTRAQAQLEVRRAPGRLLGLMLNLAQVPKAAGHARVRLVIVERTTPHGPQECWHRVFDGQPLVTHQCEAPGGLLSERVGPLEFRFRLLAEDGTMLFEQHGCWLRAGRLAVRLPRALTPIIWCRESATDMPDQTSVHVRVSAPSGRLLFSYRGTVTWNVSQETR